jgi:hypothetical protein
MLSPTPPLVTFYPSVNPKTIMRYIAWKCMKNGILVDQDGSHVIDSMGNTIYVDVGWRDPANISQISSAIGAVHEARGILFGANSKLPK